MNNNPFDSDYYQYKYSNYRDKYDDLFDSEKYFFDEFLTESNSILDVGCASGGLYNIVCSKRPNISYVGIDISKNLIEEAKRKYPNAEFQLSDGQRIKYPDNFYDSVLTLGTTVHNMNWKFLLQECLRVANKKFLFDIRLTKYDSILDLKDGYIYDGSKMKYHYIVINIYEFLKWISSLKNIYEVNIFGYLNSPNASTCLPKHYEKISMTGVLIKKNNSINDQKKNINIQLPIELFS